MLEIEDEVAFEEYLCRNLSLWPTRYLRLADAVRHRDGVAALDAVLSVRSSSQMIGAMKLAELAFGTEAALRDGNFSEAEELLLLLQKTGLIVVERLTKQFGLVELSHVEAVDWRPPVGCKVEIRLPNGAIETGTVDAVTVDGEILWLRQDGPVLRRFVEKVEGKAIRSLPA